MEPAKQVEAGLPVELEEPLPVAGLGRWELAETDEYHSRRIPQTDLDDSFTIVERPKICPGPAVFRKFENLKNHQNQLTTAMLTIN